MPSPQVLALLVAVVLPNLALFIVLFADLGLPTRAPIIPMYLILLLIARHARRLVTLFSLGAVVVIDCAWTIAGAFNLSPLDLVAAISFANDLRFHASPSYVAGVLAAGLCAMLTGAILVRHRDTLREAGLLPSLLGVIGLVGLDRVLTHVPNYDARLFGAAAAASVESAAQRSGFRDSILVDRQRDSIMVVVEALGEFRDPVLRDIVFAPLRDPSLLETYQMTTGTVPFESSTTAAELRELCQTGIRYSALTLSGAQDCLPSLLVAQGRETLAVHGFSPSMFDRSRWYPLVGFQTRIFAGDLATALPRRCGKVFLGLCDADIVSALPELGPARSPGRLLYWLTLNTHVPIEPSDARPRLDCATTGGPFGDRTICAMAELWLEVMDGVAALALDPRMHTPDILIVGDHIPPLWSRSGRRMFSADTVPWVRLRPR